LENQEREMYEAQIARRNRGRQLPASRANDKVYLKTHLPLCLKHGKKYSVYCQHIISRSKELGITAPAPRRAQEDSLPNDQLSLQKLMLSACGDEAQESKCTKIREKLKEMRRR
jgi:hypothetical protein